LSYPYKDDAYLCRIDFILIDVCNGIYWIILIGKFVGFVNGVLFLNFSLDLS